MRPRPARATLALGVLLALATPAFAQAPVVIDAIVARVNGRVILASDVRAADVLTTGTVSTRSANPIDAMVERTLMLEDVERASPATPSGDAVEARRRELEAAVGAAALARLASRDGMTPVRLRAWVRDDLRMDAYVAQRFTAAAQPTDEEVAAYFAANAARFARPGEDAGDPATDRARTALVEQRRQALIAAWIDGLRRRADVVMAPR